MSQSPFEQAEQLHVGTVDFVSPEEIKVLLDVDAPESTALNAGSPRPFPKVHGYVLVPVDEGHLVGQVAWITVERSSFPKRRGLQDFGLIDLPYPLRKLSLSPVGLLRAQPGTRSATFARGTTSLPSIGAAVVLPSSGQLKSIVESGVNRRVKIGVSPLAEDAVVMVDPNRIFGRHLAVLGNTGSGKSCSTAGLIRWSLEDAGKARTAGTPNARFIILDPNGEYASAFPKDDKTAAARVFKVEPGTGDLPLRVPLWLWNIDEWSAITQATVRTQRPALLYALRFARDGQQTGTGGSSDAMRRYLRNVLTATSLEISDGVPWEKFPKNKAFLEKLTSIETSVTGKVGVFSEELDTALKDLVESFEPLLGSRRGQYPNLNFTVQELEDISSALSRAHVAFGGQVGGNVPPEPDIPKPFRGRALVEGIEAAADMLNISEYVETLLVRVRGLLADARIAPIIDDEHDNSLEDWLNGYVGGTGEQADRIAVIDLSLVPTDVTHLLTAVIARLTLEASQRYVREHGHALPTVIVMEEAHTFIKRYREDGDVQDAARLCSQAFERIAREGRKFGLGLVLSSQRPSELSQTVLAQCNTFLLHRLSNDRDQDLVQRLLPDTLRNVLGELPSLPSQRAILLGWASELPTMVSMRDLPEGQRPRSHDPDYWGAWTGTRADGTAALPLEGWSQVSARWSSGGSDTPEPAPSGRSAP